jgi:hypothetical protein
VWRESAESDRRKIERLRAALRDRDMAIDALLAELGLTRETVDWQRLMDGRALDGEGTDADDV